MTRPRLIADICPLARQDVDSIAATIHGEQPKVALRFLDDFDAAIDRLLEFPELAQLWQTNRPDALSTIRRFVMRGFRVLLPPHPERP